MYNSIAQYQRVVEGSGPLNAGPLPKWASTNKAITHSDKEMGQPNKCLKPPTNSASFILQF